MRKALLLLSLLLSALLGSAQGTLPYIDLSFELATPPPSGTDTFVIEYGASVSIGFKITNHGPSDLDTADFVLFGGDAVPPGWALVAVDSVTGEKAYLQPGQHFIHRGIDFSGDSTATEDESYEFCFYLLHDWHEELFYQDTVAGNDTVCFNVLFKARPSTSVTDASKHADVHIYPNPALSELNIDIARPLSKAHQLSVVNVLGQKLLQTDLPAGIKNYSFDAQHLPGGQYFLIIEGPELQVKRKWLKH